MVFDIVKNDNIFFKILNNLYLKGCKNNIGISTALFYFSDTDIVNNIEIYGTMILNNIFMLDEDKKYIEDIFFYSKKYYGILNRFVRKYNINKMPIATNMDLFLNELNDHKESIKLSIIDNNAIYIFRISDIINIINKALLNCTEDMFPEPLRIKNPYNNLDLSNSNLYNIYFSIKNSNINMPILFKLYFDYNFDFDEYVKSAECLTRDLIIKENLKNSSSRRLYWDIINMLSHYKRINNNINICISPGFPKDILINIFKPFLLKYRLHKYSINPSIKHSYNIELTKKLIIFNIENPLFGRKIIKKSNISKDIDTNSVAFVFGINKNEYVTAVKNKYESININKIERTTQTNPRIRRRTTQERTNRQRNRQRLNTTTELQPYPVVPLTPEDFNPLLASLEDIDDIPPLVSRNELAWIDLLRVNEIYSGNDGNNDDNDDMPNLEYNSDYMDDNSIS